MPNVFPISSRRLASKRRARRIEGAPPDRHGVKVIRLDRAVCNEENALENFGARDDRISGALNLTDIGLAAAQLAGEPVLGLPLPLAPLRELQRQSSRNETTDYFYSLYKVNGHKQIEGAEYKHMAYVLTMHPGNRIRELRKAAGLNQGDLADASGVSQSYISQLENQQSLALDIARMRAIARVFNCTPADLLVDEDNPDRLSADERRLLRSYRAAGAEQRELIHRVAEPIVKSAEAAQLAA